MYKKKKYRVKPLDKLAEEINRVKLFAPRTRRVFLADGNALSIEFSQLQEILSLLREAFPRLERVAVYGNPHDLLEKRASELSALGEAGLKMIYLGMESGSARVLEAIRKGVTPEEIACGADKLKGSGIALSVTVLNGLAGREGSEEHALESAKLLSRIDPEYIGLLSLITVPGTTMYRLFKEGKLTPLNPWELLEEIRLIAAGLDLTSSVFRANHASNYLPLKATFPEDKERLLKSLGKVIEEKRPSSIKGEYMRGL